MFERTLSLLLMGLVCMGASCRRATPVSAQPDPLPVVTVELPHNLAEAVWTNYIVRTNGRTMALWAQYSHPPGWPTSAAPVMAWNPTSLITAFSNYTGISQCWEGEGNLGQVPMTLLTRGTLIPGVIMRARLRMGRLTSNPIVPARTSGL